MSIRSQAIDMTEGRPGVQIVRFMIPMLLGNVAQQLYNTVDSIIVGRFVGDNALAAVGSAGPIFNLLLVLIIGVSVGATVMTSTYYGARRREALSKAVGTSILLTLIVCGIIMVITPFITMPMLRLLGTPETIIGWCDIYLKIIFIGILGSALYNIICGILRGLGDATSALIYLLVATGINIVLDYTFVAIFGMGVAGVALATVIAQFISAILCIRRLLQLTDLFDLNWEYLKPDGKYMMELIRLGIPSGVTQAIFSLSAIIVQSLTNSFGETFIAANVIVMRIDGFVMMPAFSFGSAMTTYAGQNVGAGKLDRVRQGAKEGTLIAVATSVVLTVVILIFGRFLMGIFTKTEELITLSFNMMRILVVGYIAMEVTQCLSGVMRGAGDTLTPMWISMITTVAIRMPLAYGIAYFTRSPELPRGNSACIFISLLISWVIGALMTVTMYRFGRWRKTALTRMSSED